MEPNNPTIDNTPELTQQNDPRDQTAWQLYIRGWNHERIANRLGIQPTEVPPILKRVRTRLAQEYAEGKAERIAEQADRLLHIVTEALNAWEASKPRPEPKTAIPPPLPIEQPDMVPILDTWCDAPETPDPLPPTPHTQSRSGEQEPGGEGKPAYLRIAIQALKALHALWGKDAPQPQDAYAELSFEEQFPYIDRERFRNPHLYDRDGVRLPDPAQA